MATERANDREAIDQRLLTQGTAETDLAWRQRGCPAHHRFWAVALGESRWRPDEEVHLRKCSRCCVRAVRTARGSDLPTGRPAVSPPLPGRDHLRPGARVSFADPDLSAEWEFRGRGESWLKLRHATWPEGTLVRVTISPPFAIRRPFHRLAVLRHDSDARVARIRIPFPDETAEHRLTVQAITLADIPSDIDGLTKVLAEAIDAARADDPSAVMAPVGREPSAWLTWTKYSLAGESTPEQRYVLGKVRDVLAALDRIDATERGDRLYLE